MLPICINILKKISEFLTDEEKIKLTMISLDMNKLKHKLMYREKINVTKIKNLSYFNNFEYIEISNFEYVRIPKKVKHVYLELQSKSSVIHLALDWDFAFGMKNISVSAHSTFSEFFNDTIKRNLPSSITHLTFGNYFNKPIDDIIPPTVTHLAFGWFFNHSINNIPKSVIEVKLHRKYDTIINDEIASRVRIICI
uniref:F-box domain-containing protein n=1 Tax=viral metagenome TaxID=1070528 RepID=A0A6C0C9X8_9ZZZZ